jgi:DeoR family transcriptional regulator, aga operon transcriptional repressor
MGDVVAGLPAEVRQSQTATLVAAHGFVRVRDLADRFGVSEVTMRADLDHLERRGELRRVHGGAMSGHSARVERTFEEQATLLFEEKSEIGRLAAALVSSGESIIVDVGTTTTALARALVARPDLHDVTVITNGLTIAMELERGTPRLNVVVTGGTLRVKQHSLVNPMGSQFFDQFRATRLFLGCNGIDPVGGVTNINLPEAEMKRAMVAAAREVIVLADGSKLGEVAFASVCAIDQVDMLVTNDTANPEIVAELRAHNVDVVIA